jgi:hypothetical protein
MMSIPDGKVEADILTVQRGGKTSSREASTARRSLHGF